MPTPKTDAANPLGPDESLHIDVTCCAFCGADLEGSVIGPMTHEFHETFTLLVLADPGSSEYDAHLAEARRILDVQA